LLAHASLRTKDGNGLMAIHIAAGQGFADVVQDLVNAGADVGATTVAGGDTPLTLACAGGFKDVVIELLAAKADVNVRNDRHRSALMSAAMYDHIAVLPTLLAAGADINATGPNGETALSLATDSKFTQLAELLRRSGASEAQPQK
jgi:hypothetical protein